VTLYATSRAGQPLQAAKFVIRPSAGTVSEPVAVEAGVFAAVWTVPPDASGTARITASLADAPSLASVAEVAVDPAPPEDELPSIASAPAVVVGQEPRAPPSPLAFAVSPKLGLVSNGHDFTSPAIAAEASIRTDRFGPRLELLGEVSWAFSTLSSVATVSPGTSVTVRSRADYLTAAAAVGFIWPFGDASAAFVHAGPTLARVQSTLKMTGRPSATASTFVPGAQFSLGIERRFRGSTPFAELRWSFSSDPSLDPVLSGSLKWFGVHAGARLDLL
jgi:hypothetical protein